MAAAGQGYSYNWPKAGPKRTRGAAHKAARGGGDVPASQEPPRNRETEKPGPNQTRDDGQDAQWSVSALCPQ